MSIAFIYIVGGFLLWAVCEFLDYLFPVKK